MNNFYLNNFSVLFRLICRPKSAGKYWKITQEKLSKQGFNYERTLIMFSNGRYSAYRFIIITLLYNLKSRPFDFFLLHSCTIMQPLCGNSNLLLIFHRKSILSVKQWLVEIGAESKNFCRTGLGMSWFVTCLLNISKWGFQKKKTWVKTFTVQFIFYSASKLIPK